MMGWTSQAGRRGMKPLVAGLSLICVIVCTLPVAAAGPAVSGHVARVTFYPPFSGVSNSSMNTTHTSSGCVNSAIVNPGTFDGATGVGSLSFTGSARSCPGHNLSTLKFERNLYTFVPVSSAHGPNADIQTNISGHSTWTGSFGNCTPVRGGSRLGYCEVDVAVYVGVTDYNLDTTTGAISGPVAFNATEGVMYESHASAHCGISSCNWTSAPLRGSGAYGFHFGGLGFGHMNSSDSYDQVVGVGGLEVFYFENNSYARLTGANVNIVSTFQVSWYSVTLF